MSNKTCVECRYLGNAKETGLCEKRKICLYPEELPACKNFVENKPTNGDKIRQGGDRDFAEYFVYETGAVFGSTLIVDKTFDTYEEAVKATEDYLDAPAESEGGR